jgi:hypothetical protein
MYEDRKPAHAQRSHIYQSLQEVISIGHRIEINSSPGDGSIFADLPGARGIAHAAC